MGGGRDVLSVSTPSPQPRPYSRSLVVLIFACFFKSQFQTKNKNDIVSTSAKEALSLNLSIELTTKCLTIYLRWAKMTCRGTITLFAV